MRRNWILGSVIAAAALAGCPPPAPTTDVVNIPTDVQGTGDVQGVDVRIVDVQGDGPLPDNQGIDVRSPDVQGTDAQGDVQGTDVQGPDVQGTDVQGDVQGDVLRPDVQRPDVQGTDAQGTGAPLFANCVANADCASNACLTSVPGGMCTAQCTRDAACGAAGVCALNGATGICFPRCTPADQVDLSTDPMPTPPADFGACVGRPAFCTAISQLDPTKGACVPTCFTSTPPDPSWTCSGALQCDDEQGACVATLSTGGITGASCPTGNDACRSGFCYPEQYTDPDTGMLQHTGFLQGSCTSFARSIDQAELETFLMTGGSWPHGSCPVTGVPYFIFDVLGEFAFPQPAGEETLCFGRCSASSPCRPGYECLSSGDFFNLSAFGGVDSSDGVCFPIDCSIDGGPMCPVGTTCVTTTDMTTGRTSGTCQP